MRNLSFENRASLNQKNEDIIRVVEELSSSYVKREEFAIKNSHLSSEMHTSEVCSVFGFFCVVLTVGALANVALIYTVAETAFAVDCTVEATEWLCDNRSIDNNTIFSNIV